MRLEVLMAAEFSVLVLCIVTTCGPAGKYRRLGGTHCLNFYG